MSEMSVQKAIAILINGVNAKTYSEKIKAEKMAIKALEKQIPQHPIETQELMDIEWLCPVCGYTLSRSSRGIDDYCAKCGQMIG